jgi:hypothetical protein
MPYKLEILRLTPQNDITVQSLKRGTLFLFSIIGMLTLWKVRYRRNPQNLILLSRLIASFNLFSFTVRAIRI